MSNYIKVLKRLERDRLVPESSAASADRAEGEPVPPVAAAATRPAIQAPATPPTAPVTLRPVPSPAPARPVERIVPPAPVAPAAPQPIPAAPVSAPAPRRPLDPRRVLAPETVKGIAGLLDNIRALAAGRNTRTVVFAGASKANAVDLVTEGLAAHARGQGVQVFIAELIKVEGRSVLAARTNGRSIAPFEIDLDGGASPSELNGWLERVAPAAQLIVITGPPLADSIDAALLACGSDGLVIVAQSEITERATLQVAAERARIAGCRTLGVVMHGTQQRMPAWIRRFMGTTPPHEPSRED